MISGQANFVISFTLYNNRLSFGRSIAWVHGNGMVNVPGWLTFLLIFIVRSHLFLHNITGCSGLCRKDGHSFRGPR